MQLINYFLYLIFIFTCGFCILDTELGGKALPDRCGGVFGRDEVGDFVVDFIGEDISLRAPVEVNLFFLSLSSFSIDT